MADVVPATLIVGGWTLCDTNDFKVQEVVKFSIDQYNKQQEKRLEFVDGIKAEKQIVNGVLYKLFLKAKDGDGLGYYETLVYDQLDRMELLEFYPVEFDPLIIGGWTDAGNDVGIDDLAKFAVDEYNKKEGKTLEFAKLKNAQKQLVAGILYRLTLVATDDGHKKLYQAMVIVIPWKKTKELEDFKRLLLNVED